MRPMFAKKTHIFSTIAEFFQSQRFFLPDEKVLKDKVGFGRFFGVQTLHKDLATVGAAYNQKDGSLYLTFLPYTRWGGGNHMKLFLVCNMVLKSMGFLLPW